MSGGYTFFHRIRADVRGIPPIRAADGWRLWRRCPAAVSLAGQSAPWNGLALGSRVSEAGSCFEALASDRAVDSGPADAEEFGDLGGAVLAAVD